MIKLAVIFKILVSFLLLFVLILGKQRSIMTFWSCQKQLQLWNHFDSKLKQPAPVCYEDLYRCSPIGDRSLGLRFGITP